MREFCSEYPCARRRALAALSGLLLAGAANVPAAAPRGNDPAARFRGAPTYDLAVTNVKWEAATKEYSYVTFDLSWGHSWRAKWTEPATNNVTGQPLTFENWDAAWVFVKFLPEKDLKQSIEQNHWRHATLDTDASRHLMPAGATNTVGLTADGKRGLGVFIYRDAIGHGANDFKGVRLRWRHPPSSAAAHSGVTSGGEVDPAKAAIKVHAIAMVYVPEGPFQVGGYGDRVIPPFLPGPTVPVVFGGGGVLMDGSRHGGPLIPFLVDAEWNGPAAEGSRARRIGPFPGQLWGSLCYAERMAWGASVGQAGALNDDFPTGYDAIYCMKYPLTQGQYADFLNSLPPDVAAARAFVGGDADDPENAGGRIVELALDLGPGYVPAVIREQDGHTIISSFTLSGDEVLRIPARPDIDRIKVLDDMGRFNVTLRKDPILAAFMADVMLDKQEKEKLKNKPKPPPVYVARLPFRRCNYISTRDYFSYAVWAGLRPMSELEYTKVLRGPLRDVSIGSWHRARPPPRDEGLPTERYPNGNHPASDFGSRVGSFATADSDRNSAGATYWGILDFSHAQVVPLTSGRAFRGTPGDGRTPAGTPGAPLKRSHGPIFDTAPADWPRTAGCGTKEGFSRVWVSGEHMGDSRKAGNFGRLVSTAGNRTRRKPEPKRPETTAAQSVAAAAARAGNARGAALGFGAGSRADTVRVTNLKLEAVAKDTSTISFDLSWEDSWRAVWTEPPEQNVTGRPLKLESWDAAWVFVKFRMPGAGEDSHATLAPATRDHQVPAGAALDVGLAEDDERGVGVFVYRSGAARGPNNFRNVKLRWLHPPADKLPGSSGVTGAPGFDPAKAKLTAHAIEMVYIPEGPFKSKSPWGFPLTLIDTGDARMPGGHAVTHSNEVPLNATWPNGYKAYYFMKHAISQRQYAWLLNSMTSNRNGGRYSAGTYWCRAARYDAGLYGVNGFAIRYTPGEGTYAADFPDRACNLLSWPDILSFTAWAGLRLPTDLEYEKACRGPRDVARAEDAWAPATCRPAASMVPFDGAPASVGEPGRGEQGRPGAVAAWTYGSYGASYWGIYGLSLSGNILEWPGVFQRWSARWFAGSHGDGTPWAPEDWPWSAVGEFVAKGQWFGTENTAVWVDPFQIERTMAAWEAVDAGRTGRFGARTARTAPSDQSLNPLRMDRLPDMRGFDVVIFPLSGHFRNDGESALQVELATPLPDACFPGGSASRAFSAAPQAVTPFRILTALSSLSAAEAVRGKGGRLVFRIRAGDKVLAERTVRLFVHDSQNVTPAAIGSLAGGEVALRIANVTDRPHPVAITMPAPAGVRLGETERRVEIAAGAEARAAFPILRQGFAREGVRKLPYRFTTAGGDPQSGATAADLRNQSRWWVSRHVDAWPQVEEAGLGSTVAIDVTLVTEKNAPTGVPDGLFEIANPPAGWQQAVSVTNIPLAEAGLLPTWGSSALAATRFVAPADGAALLSVRYPRPPEGSERFPFIVRIWLNEERVFQSPSYYEDFVKLMRAGTNARSAGKALRLRAGANTLVVACDSNVDESTVPAGVDVKFLDAETGVPIIDLILDMETRQLE